MATSLMVCWTVFFLFYVGSNANRSCTCRVSTQSECESAGRLKYDTDDAIVSQCSWDSVHDLCRNTDWLQCKQDPYCLWIKKEDPNEPPKTDDIDDDPCDVKEDNIIFEYSSDEQQENQMVVSLHSLSQMQSSKIRVLAFCVVLFFITGTGMYHLLGSKLSKKIHESHSDEFTLYPAQQYTTYSTF